ncbi:hypothetical protein [Bartonella birtlesii]|uniref:hypothetical protein n=2 Tax=Bartonella birtlesii TaxID=111504 RepID=UPI000686B8EB|nr:hypothetical protein [Bartonella birtlesii]
MLAFYKVQCSCEWWALAFMMMPIFMIMSMFFMMLWCLVTQGFMGVPSFLVFLTCIAMQKFINYAVINGCTKIYGTAGVGRSSEVYGFVYRNAKISYCAKVWGEGIWQYKTQQKKQSKIDSQKENLKRKPC